MKLNWLRSEQPRFAVGLSVFAFVAGIGLALSFVGVSTAFQRSGALLIAFTIALAAFDLNFKIGEVMDDQNIQKWRILKLQNELKIREIEKHCMPERYETEKLRREILATEALMVDGRMDIEILNFSQQKRARLIRLDGYLGIAGTLIWGFGDLPF